MVFRGLALLPGDGFDGGAALERGMLDREQHADKQKTGDDRCAVFVFLFDLRIARKFDLEAQVLTPVGLPDVDRVPGD